MTRSTRLLPAWITPLFIGLLFGSVVLRAVSALRQRPQLLAILGFGMQYLTVRTPFLAYANEAVLPFYILHQTAILTLAFPIVQWPIPDGWKFALILAGSFLLSMAVYEGLVRRSNLLRLLFGMKTLPPRAAETQALLAGQKA